MLTIGRYSLAPLEKKTTRFDIWIQQDAQILGFNAHPLPPHAPVLWTIHDTSSLGEKRAFLFVWMAFGNLDFLASDPTEAAMMHIQSYESKPVGVYQIFEISPGLTIPDSTEIDEYVKRERPNFRNEKERVEKVTAALKRRFE